MTTIATGELTAALRRAVVRATLAPSVHNTQPWRFVLTDGGIEIYADRSRKLHVLDPHQRQLMISCGCALMNARISLAGAGVAVDVHRFPDPAQPAFVARITANPVAAVDRGLAALDSAIEQRRTNRREFIGEPVPDEFVDAIVEAGAREGAEVFVVRDLGHRIDVASLSQRADSIENADPAYRAELRAWTSDDPTRPDGVPAFAVPHVDAGAEDDIPIRDFDTRGMGWLPTRTRSTMNQCLLLLGSDSDGPQAWLTTGEALERMLLEIARGGFAASPLTQVVEVTYTNEMLRQRLNLDMHPHVLLRVGHAPETPQTRRRRLIDVISVRR